MSHKTTKENSQLIWIVRAIFVCMFFLLVYSMVRNLVELSRLDERVVDAQKEVDILTRENQELQQELEYLETGNRDEYLIRQTLGLVKPDETLVLVPEINWPSTNASTSGQTDFSRSELFADLPVYRQWLKLVVGI